MRLSEAIRIECLCPHVECVDKEDVLRHAAALAKKCDILREVPQAKILQGFKDREELSSTGIGNGVALPHCRIAGVSDFVVGMITLTTAVEFDSIDGKGVNLVAFIVGPDSDTTDHPRILSGLSLSLASEEDRQRLLQAQTGEELQRLLAQPGATTAHETPSDEKRLVHVVVQDTDLFHRLLEAIESIDGTSAVVLESSNTGQYLSRRPLFASFLADSPNESSRVILSAVPRNLTNELIRRMESVTGPLHDRDDIAVIVQDVFMMAGMLSI